jgi:hypothetical protein
MSTRNSWLAGLVIAGIVFVVLYVILPVALWVSIVAAVGAWLLWLAITTGGLAAPGRHHPAH